MRTETKWPRRPHRRPALLPPDGLTLAQAQTLRVPAECPPALLAVLVDIVRRVTIEPVEQPAPTKEQ